MDLLKEIGDSRLYNLHSHTQFCDGRADMEQFAAAAVAQGFTHYGFSPHAPVPIASPCNMSADDVTAYLGECERLKRIYGDKICLYAAMEIDYLSDEWGPSHQFFQSLPLDYRIGSVHFIPSEHGMIDVDGRPEDFAVKMREHFHKDLRHVVTTFYRQTWAMLDAGGFDIVGHFDKIGFNASKYQPGVEQEPWYRQLVADTIDLIAQKGVIAEINTKAWDAHQRLFPSLQWQPMLRQRHIPVVVNSDAHFPQLINAGRDHAFALLQQQ
ncbi:MAG: histidinol-phosphatase [Muribaculaceae bacterium]|nr:histidinol-phosphatase [Muribaculaceae bacterium]